MTAAPYLLGSSFTTSGGTLTITLAHAVAIGDLIYVAASRDITYPATQPHADVLYGVPTDTAGNTYANTSNPDDPALIGVPFHSILHERGDLIRWFAFSASAMSVGDTISFVVNPLNVFPCNNAVAVVAGIAGPIAIDVDGLPGNLGPFGVGGTACVILPRVNAALDVAFAAVQSIPITSPDLLDPTAAGYAELGSAQAATIGLTIWSKLSSDGGLSCLWESSASCIGAAWGDTFAFPSQAGGQRSQGYIF